MTNQDPTERTKLGLSFASDSCKQVLGLSTTILSFTVAFRNDVVKQTTGANQRWLWLSWIALGVSIVAGVWTYLAMTGSVAAKTGSMDVYSTAVRIPAAIQMLSFLVGLVLLATFGVVALRSPGKPAAPEGECRIVAPASGQCTLPP